MSKALTAVNDLVDKPDLLLTGGDQIMDALATDRSRAQAQWEVFLKTLRDCNGLPVEHCIGNHDVCGSEIGVDEVSGKRLAMDVLGLSSRYRSFDRAGWHFVVLDSTYPIGGSYVAKLDEEQFEWLREDLAGTPPDVPVLVLSHMPILAACAYFHGNNESSGNWHVPGAWVHIDARRIKDTFREFPNVRVCLSGHIHLVDRVEYLGVTYLCNGAVCGSWWNGCFQECAPGYAIVDLYDDGSFNCEYREWGWLAD